MTSMRRSRFKPGPASSGRSTRITSAPMSASIMPANGPGPIGFELEDAQAGEWSHFCSRRRGRYMLRRYCPPTSNSASVICPSEHTRTASISTSKTLPLAITVSCSRRSIAGASAAWR